MNTEPENRIPEILQAFAIFSEKLPIVDRSSRKSDGILAKASWLKENCLMQSGGKEPQIPHMYAVQFQATAIGDVGMAMGRK